MPDQSSSLFSQFGPWVVAILALVQVWVIALWKKFVKLSRVTIHESGLIEIGYSGFGPTIGLIGTLRCLNRDTFISKISLTVVRLKDNAKHTFQWRAFRGHTIAMGDPKSITLEIATSFMLTTSSPNKYTIFFNDEQVLDDLKARVGDIRTKWQDNLQELVTARKEGGLTLDQVLANAPVTEVVFATFSQRSDVADGYTAIDRMNYWDEGDYSLLMTVEASEPDKIFIKNWRFTLTPDHVKLVRLNSVGILRELCGLLANYNFANVPYRKPA